MFTSPNTALKEDRQYFLFPPAPPAVCASHPHLSVSLSTGFFFLLSWALFTNQHIAEIQDDITRLGSSYWLGVVGWALLLAVLPVVFLVEQCVVPAVLPELMRAAETWWKAPEVAYARSVSESCYYKGAKFDNGFKRHLSVP